MQVLATVISNNVKIIQYSLNDEIVNAILLLYNILAKILLKPSSNDISDISSTENIKFNI